MKRNAFFQLVQKQDGVYLKSYPALEGGAPLSVDDILYYLEQKKIMDVSVDDITSFVQKASETVNAEKRIMIGKILPENEFPVVTIDPESLQRSAFIPHQAEESDFRSRSFWNGSGKTVFSMVS